MITMDILQNISVLMKFLTGRVLTIVVIVPMLSSCGALGPAWTDPVNQMVPHDIGKYRKFNAELEFVTFNISDQLEEPEKRYYKINRTEITYLSEQWKLALVKTLERADIFKSNSKNKLSLTVTVLEASTHTFFGTKADIKARYQIKDLKTGAVVCSKDIRTNDGPKGIGFGDDLNTSILKA